MNQAPRDSDETLCLLEEVRAGSQEAVEALFSRHRDCLRRFVHLRIDQRISRRADTSDVVQEAQLEAFRRLPDYLRRRPMPFRVWLLRTAHQCLLKMRRYHMNAIRRTVKREVSLPERSSQALALDAARPSAWPGQRLHRRELALGVRRAIAELSHLDQEILLLRNFEGLTNQEVAHVLGIEPVAASRRLGRALLRLQDVLRARGLVGTGA